MPDQKAFPMVSGPGEVVLVSCRSGSRWVAPVSCSQASAVVQVSSSRAGGALASADD
jgi:hypothetical protein